jgi:hypothetical protein
MLPIEFLFDGPADATWTIALAHGAGAAMDTPFMNCFAGGLANRGFRVARFEFPYMAARRRSGKRSPPDREGVLLDTWRTVIEELGHARLVIGGKSMGGRMASMVADEGQVAGLVCLGYPFHPAGYDLSPSIQLHWLTDGDHDFKPRRASGQSQEGNWAEAIDAIEQFIDWLPSGGKAKARKP